MNIYSCIVVTNCKFYKCLFNDAVSIETIRCQHSGNDQVIITGNASDSCVDSRCESQTVNQRTSQMFFVISFEYPQAHSSTVSYPS
jgi:hypothetical protein